MSLVASWPTWWKVTTYKLGTLTSSSIINKCDEEAVKITSTRRRVLENFINFINKTLVALPKPDHATPYIQHPRLYRILRIRQIDHLHLFWRWRANFLIIVILLIIGNLSLTYPNYKNSVTKTSSYEILISNLVRDAWRFMIFSVQTSMYW